MTYYTPEQHYEHALDLITCIGANKDNPTFDTHQASVLAQTASAQALMGILAIFLVPEATKEDLQSFVAEHRGKGHQLVLNSQGVSVCNCGDQMSVQMTGDR